MGNYGQRKHYKAEGLIEHVKERLRYWQTEPERRISECEDILVYLEEARDTEKQTFSQLDGEALAYLVKLMYLYLQSQKDVGSWCLSHVEGFARNKTEAVKRAADIIDNQTCGDDFLEVQCEKSRQYNNQAAVDRW